MWFVATALQWVGGDWKGGGRGTNSKPPEGAAECSQAAPLSDAKGLYIILKQALLVYRRRASDSNPDQLPLVRDRWRCQVKAVHLLAGTWRGEGRRERFGISGELIFWKFLFGCTFMSVFQTPTYEFKLEWGEEFHLKKIPQRVGWWQEKAPAAPQCSGGVPLLMPISLSHTAVSAQR